MAPSPALRVARAAELLERGDPFVEVDAEWRVVRVNAGYEELWGRLRSEAIGRLLWELWSDRLAARPGAWGEYHACMADRTRVQFRERDTARDRWFAVTAVPVSTGGIAIFHRDITGFIDVDDTPALLALEAEIEARKRAERAELRLRRLCEAGIIGVFNWTMDGRIVAGNDRFLEMIGYTREDLETGRIDWARMTPTEYAPLDRFAVAELRRSGADTPYEKEFVRKDGSRVAIIVGAAMLDEARHEGIGFTLDVTDRKRALEALRRSEQRYRSLVEASTQVVWCTNAQGEVELDIPSWQAFTGQTAEQARGFGWMDVISPEDRDRVAQAARSASESRGMCELEYRVRRHDGVWRSVLARGVPILDAQGYVREYIGACIDVTEQRRYEEQLRAANARLVEADRRKDEFLGMLSHELRNPLAPIRNSIHVLRRAPPEGEQARRAHRVIERQTEHLTRLVDDLLDVTRITRGKIELHAERVDLGEVVRRSSDDHRSVFCARGLGLVLDVPPAPLWADADPTRVAQVVGNLLQNAAKFTSSPGEVKLSVRRVSAAAGGATQDAAEIRVRDTGVGIASDLLQRVFEPFVQSQSSLARTEGGLGLGLAMVKGIAELHGGAARAESDGPGKGTEIVVTIPLADAAADRVRLADAAGDRSPVRW